MFPFDLAIAMKELWERYHSSCCVDKIENNIIRMSNGDILGIDNYGHIYTIK